MALTERSRSTLYRRLTDVIRDEEAVGEVLSYFPARDVEEPASKELVLLTAAELRAEMGGLRTEMGDIRAEVAAVERRLTTLVHTEVQRSMRLTIGATAGMCSLLAAVVAAVS